MADFSTSLFIADTADAEAIMFEYHDDDRWPNIWLKRIGDLELEQLWAITANLHAKPSRPLIGMSELLYQLPDKSAAVLKLPESFIASLAGLPQDRVFDLAEKWRNSVELTHWNIAELSEILHTLCAFMRRSLELRKSVLQLAC